MTQLLYISASPRGDASAANQAAQYFLDAVPGNVTVTELNLFDADLPEYTRELASAKQSTMMGAELKPEEAAEWAAVTRLTNQFLAADHLLLAIPMWNFTIPYKFKQYIDLITHPNVTFTVDKDGPRGIGSASGTIIYSRGGNYSPKDGQPDPFDFQSPYMNAWCSLVGIAPVTDVLVQGTMGGPDALQSALDAAKPQLQTLAAGLG